MKNKGFTLVELLAMLVVLGVLMTVAIPNITGILNNQKKNTLRNDATTMVETAKIKVAKDNLIKKPDAGKCIVFSLNYLNDNDNINAGPNGGQYDEFDSFVIYKKEKNGNNVSYKYYVRLIENNVSYYYGIELEDIRNITENTSTNIKRIESYTSIGLSKTATDNESKLANNSTVKSVCPNGVTKYYVRKDN